MRGIGVSTVVDHVLKAAGFGLPLDWKRAASELQLGPKDSVGVPGSLGGVWKADRDARGGWASPAYLAAGIGQQL